MKELKQKILANLEFLPDKVSLKKSETEVVTLNSSYFDEQQQRNYSLSIELIVTKQKVNDEIIIDEFFIEDVFFHYNNGCTPRFNFTRKELNEYIDY